MRTSLLCPIGLCFGLTGCLTAGNYHSARTLEKGTSAFGLTFSMTTYEYTDSSGDKERFTLPNVIPELTYHLGMTDDLEAGGRIALGSFSGEFDVKYRFVESEGLHLAVAPAVGYQAFGFVQGTTVRLPAILTYDLNDTFAVNLAAFGSTTHYSEVDEDENEFAVVPEGTFGAVGAAIGVELRGEVFAIRPSVEWTRWQFDFSESDDFERFNTVNVLVHLSFISGREKKQLNRMERKIDRVIDNQEGRPHPPNEPRPTDTSPYPQPEEPMR